MSLIPYFCRITKQFHNPDPISGYQLTILTFEHLNKKEYDTEHEINDPY